MHEQLHEIIDDLKAAQARLHALATRVPDAQWGVRPEAGRWSVSENVEHLNLTSAAYIPVLQGALAEAATLGGTAPRRYRRGFVGWMLWRIMPPPVRVIRTRTAAAFIPTADMPAPALRERFDRLQRELISITASADGLVIDDVMMVSPFDARVRYNLFAGLGLVPRHQHRHLWQAETTVSP